MLGLPKMDNSRGRPGKPRARNATGKSALGKAGNAADAKRGSAMRSAEIRKTASRRVGAAAMDFGFPRTRGDALRICPVEAYSNWTEVTLHSRGSGWISRADGVVRAVGG